MIGKSAYPMYLCALYLFDNRLPASVIVGIEKKRRYVKCFKRFKSLADMFGDLFYFGRYCVLNNKKIRFCYVYSNNMAKFCSRNISDVHERVDRGAPNRKNKTGIFPHSDKAVCRIFVGWKIK